MKHSFKKAGFAYALRPVELTDAQFIIDTRLEDAERNRFIHKISTDVSAQEQWIRDYFSRAGDYYFVVENVLTGRPEGLIAVYDIQENKGEWGRWVIQQGSLAAIESLDLLCQVAFDELELDEIYSRTVEDNTPVVSFHNSAKEKYRGIIPAAFQIEGVTYNAVEHYIPRDYYHGQLMFDFQQKAQLIFNRQLKMLLGDFKFHHIGYACSDFDKEMQAFKLLGYRQKDADFTDETQGIVGRFLVAGNQPEVELLKNSEGSHTLDYWLNNKIKVYHFAYTVKDFDKALKNLTARRCKVVKEAAVSTYFGKRICFLVMPNLWMIELIEV